jgi:SAM-dependent methyltransferase
MDRKVIHENKAITIDKNFKTLFNELEKRHIEIRAKVNSFSEKGNELEERLSEEIEIFETWRFHKMERLSEITSNFDKKQKKAHQKFIKNTEYYKIVQEAPFYWRIMNKPNGYAGDAEMMSFIYRNQFEGKTPFGMFLHKHAVATKACKSVRNRKDYIIEQILKTNGGQFLSLAAGPAQEIREILNGHKRNGYKFIALDHDLDTLQRYDIPNTSHQFTYALANAFQIVSGKYRVVKPKRYMVKYCYPRRDFKGLRKILSSLKYELIDLKSKRFDMIYSAGLYDYIQTFPLDDSKGTVALTKNLFNLLKPGGSLIIGNFNHNNPKDLRFVMEYVYDWRLIYRNKFDMFDFARSISENDIKDMQIIEEPTGINFFLKIDKN